MSRKRTQKKREYNRAMWLYAQVRRWYASEPPRWRVISHWLWKRRKPKWEGDW